MLYWSLNDDLSIVIMVLYALSIYFAYSLTRMTSGAPAAWYVIIFSFLLVLVRKAVQVYFDVQTASIPFSEIEESILSIVVSLCLAVGLYMLLRAFRRQLVISREGHVQA